jgi:DNA replication and repair protein RecF
MEIKSLTLKNFRNYEKLEIGDFCTGLNIISGKNAQGKTNIIEAISYLASGKSFRCARDAYSIREGQAESYVRASYCDEGITRNLEMLLQRGHKKAFKISGEPVRKMSELFRALVVVLFSPEDLKIVKEAPQLRRHFLDEEICKIRPSYLDALKNFQTLLAQKSAALKQFQNASLIDAYNEQLCGYISVILKNRESYCEKLTQSIRSVLCTMEVGEEVVFRYAPTIQKEEIKQALDRIRSREMQERQCLTGPQRDEVEITINGRESKFFASQGQIRMIMLATKIAAVKIIADSTDRVPVLLLDDVFSELDPARRQWVIKNLTGMQTFLTTANLEEARNMEGKLYNVQSGTVSASGRK